MKEFIGNLAMTFLKWYNNLYPLHTSQPCGGGGVAHLSEAMSHAMHGDQGWTGYSGEF